MPLLDTRHNSKTLLSSPLLNVARETAEVGSRWGALFFCTSVVHTYRTYIVAKQGLGAHRKKAEGGKWLHVLFLLPSWTDKLVTSTTYSSIMSRTPHSHLVGQIARRNK